MLCFGCPLCFAVALALALICSRDQLRPDMRPELNPLDSHPSGSGSGSGSASASKSYTSTSGPSHAHPCYPSSNVTSSGNRINSSEKRLTLVDSFHGDDDHSKGHDVDDDDDEDNKEGLYKSSSRRTDLDSLEAGRYDPGGVRVGLRYDGDEVVGITKPCEVYKY